MPNWLTPVIVVIAVMVIMPMIGRLMTRSTSAADRSAIMRGSRVYKWTGVIVAALLGFFAVASQTFWANETSTLWALFVLLAFVGLGIYIAADALRSRQVIGEDGVEYHGIFRGLSFMAWQDVDRVSISFMGTWVLHAGGRRHHVSFVMTNQPMFAQAVLRHVPAAAIDDAARKLLDAAAKGKAPRAFSRSPIVIVSWATQSR